jgi:outer membrane protein TolC
MENGRWKMVDGRWLMVDGRWKMGDGKWKMEDGISLRALQLLCGLCGYASFLYHKGRRHSRLFGKKFTQRALSIMTLISAVFFINIPAFGQSVDSLISEALRNNPQLKSQQYKIDAAGYRAESVNSLPAPNLGIEFNQVPVSSANIINDAISNNLSISQMFPIGGKVSAMTEVEKRNLRVEKDNYESNRVNLISKIKMSYYNLWQIERKIEVQQQTIDLLNNLYNSAASLLQVNRINQADVLTLKSEIAGEQTELLNLSRQKDVEIYNLNQLAGRELSSKDIHTVNEIETDSLKLTNQQLEQAMVNSNPDLNRMSSMADMNQAMIKANRKELIPDLMIQGMFMRMPQGMILTSKTDLAMLAMEPPKTEYMYSVMASINLPFAPWSVKKYTARESELESGIKSIEYEKTNMQREMFARLNNALSRMNTAGDLIKLYSLNVIPLYRQAAEAQISAYQNGRTGINTVIDSYRMLLMQQMKYFMAQADSKMALAEIEMMVGKEIKNGELK